MKKIISWLVSAGAVLSLMPANYSAAQDTALKDSGIDYTETVETIRNPGMGYTSTVWARCKPGATPVYNPSGSIVLFFINIGAFSSGINEEGVDYDLDETFFDSWRQTFENCRKNGCMIAMRFRYDENGVDNPEPATFDKVLDHIEQIKASGLPEEYKDIIAFVESGFVGKWGEQHGGKYTSVDYKAQVLDALLDCFPSPIPVTVRTADTYAKWAGTERSKLDTFVPDDPDAFRVGMYNDGYMGSNSDLGTFANRKLETDWLGGQTLNTYYGGEFSGNIEFAKKYEDYLPQNSIPEMYKTHLSYINGNIFKLYNDYTFGEEYDVEGVDNSAYYGETVFQFIRDHLGYRFVLRDSELSEKVAQGGELDLHFKVENTGFANPIPKQKAEILLERGGCFVRADLDADSNKWYSCSTAEVSAEFRLPDNLPAGDWNVYLKLSEGENTTGQVSCRSVRFANKDVWNAAMGANYLGTFTVTESGRHGVEDSFYQTDSSNAEIRPYEFFTVKGGHVVDGEQSFPQEWTEDMIVGEKDGQTVSVTADDKYFYVKGELNDGAVSPVFNLRLINPVTERSYWIYFASNGYVYFNNDSYEDSICKWNGGTVEFRIPFGRVMELYPGSKVESMRLFIQDSSNDWVLTGEATGYDFVIPSDFTVYSSVRHIRLPEGGSEHLRVETSLDGAEYQWCLNGVTIEGANKDYFDIVDAGKDSEGMYSVRVTSANGIVKDIEICDLLEVVSDSVVGDVNGDGSVTTADLVMLHKYLLGAEKLTGTQMKNGDINSDGRVDTFDLVLLRKILIE